MVTWYAETEAEYQELIARRDWYYQLQEKEEWNQKVKVRIVKTWQKVAW